MALSADLSGLGLPVGLSEAIGQSDLVQETAAGVTQQGAVAIAGSQTAWLSSPSNAGAILPAIYPLSRPLFVRNLSASTASLSVYPPLGGVINDLGQNIPLTIQPGQSAVFVCQAQRGGQIWIAYSTLSPSAESVVGSTAEIAGLMPASFETVTLTPNLVFGQFVRISLASLSSAEQTAAHLDDANARAVYIISDVDPTQVFKRIYDGPLYLTWFGATQTDAGLNNRIALQNAFSLSNALMNSVKLPEGTWNIDTSVAAIDPGFNCFLEGEGVATSIIHWANENANNLMVSVNALSTKGTVQISNLGFTGNFNGTGYAGACVQLWGYDLVYVNNVATNNIAGNGLMFDLCNICTVDGFFTNNCAKGQIYFAECRQLLVSHIRGSLLGDDLISVHCSNLDPFITQTPSGNENIIITDVICRLIAGHAIASLGGREVNISHVHGDLCEGIYVQAEVTGTARQQSFSLQFSDITLNDCIGLDRQGQNYSAAFGIQVGVAGAVRGGPDSDGVIPTLYDATSGLVVYPYNHRDGVTTGAVSPMSGVQLSNILIQRTRPAVANVSDYGFGTPNAQGISLDPAITDLSLRPNVGFAQLDPSLAFQMDHFHIEGVVGGVSLPFWQYSRENMLTNGQLVDFQTGLAISPQPGSQQTYNLKIKNVEFDGDPLRTGAASNINGSYSSASFPFALNFGTNAAGVVIEDCSFRNIAKLTNATMANHRWLNNTCYASVPAAYATFSTSNKGIGALPPTDQTGFATVIYDADPTSTTFNQNLQFPLYSSPTQPSTGWYPQGWVVRNTAPALSGGVTNEGFIKLTTGSTNVAGTDWANMKVAN